MRCIPVIANTAKGKNVWNARFGCLSCVQLGSNHDGKRKLRKTVPFVAVQTKRYATFSKGCGDQKARPHVPLVPGTHRSITSHSRGWSVSRQLPPMTSYRSRPVDCRWVGYYSIFLRTSQPQSTPIKHSSEQEFQERPPQCIFSVPHSIARVEHAIHIHPCRVARR